MIQPKGLAMIQLIQNLWRQITGFFLPDQYFAWQTIIYLAIFSWVMSWVGRFSGVTAPTEFIMATGSWIFWAVGIGWFLEVAKLRPLGIPIAPWVSGAIVCTYLAGLVPGISPTIALVIWPLVSAGVVVFPNLLDWELKPKNPPPMVRQQLVLVVLLSVLFSSWFQFYFQLQGWLRAYPTLMSDDFSRSGFVSRLSPPGQGRMGGIPLLTAAEGRVKAELQGTPWPWVERWLLNLEGQMQKIQLETRNVLEDSAEASFWELKARPRSENNGYILEMMALWTGPTAEPDSYYLTKRCVIRPEIPAVSRGTTPGEPPLPDAPEPTALAQVSCDLEIPKRLGHP